MSEKKKEENISIFSDLDIMKIQKEKAREKLLRKKLDIVRKLYYRTSKALRTVSDQVLLSDEYQKLKGSK